MHNPIRRNKNIGTAKQGHSKDNKMHIPHHAETGRYFYEQLGEYKKYVREINGIQFTFVVEKTRKDSRHACTVSELVQVIEKIPVKEYGSLRLILLRQPKRKEEMLAPVWGRCVYEYVFEGVTQPVIMLEAVNYTKKLKWSTRLSPLDQKELARLRKDGHNLIQEKNFFVAEYNEEAVRQTQLYRTFPHEFGHYVHYRTLVEEPVKNNSAQSETALKKSFFSMSENKKEAFAHKYADTLTQEIGMWDSNCGPYFQ